MILGSHNPYAVLCFIHPSFKKMCYLCDWVHGKWQFANFLRQKKRFVQSKAMWNCATKQEVTYVAVVVNTQQIKNTNPFRINEQIGPWFDWQSSSNSIDRTISKLVRWVSIRVQLCAFWIPRATNTVAVSIDNSLLVRIHRDIQNNWNVIEKRAKIGQKQADKSTRITWTSLDYSRWEFTLRCCVRRGACNC